MRKWLLLTLATAMLLPRIGLAHAEGLHRFVRGSWEEIRRTHAGRPTVVHFWGLTCAPCRVEMPRWGELLSKRADLNLVTIHADLVLGEPAAVAATLRRVGLARAENWTFNDRFIERLRYEIDPQWQGQIPLTILMSPDGTTTTIEGVADQEAIRAWLDDQVRARR